MSVLSEIDRIKQGVANSYAAVVEKGGTISQEQTIENLPSAINSISDGGSFGSEVYHVEETRIGTWIDGKPIYRRIVEGTVTTSNGWMETGVTVSGAVLLRVYGKVYETSKSHWVSIPNNNMMGAISSDYKFQIFCGSSAFNKGNYLLVFEYIK